MCFKCLCTQFLEWSKRRSKGSGQPEATGLFLQKLLIIEVSCPFYFTYIISDVDCLERHSIQEAFKRRLLFPNSFSVSFAKTMRSKKILVKAGHELKMVVLA